MWGALVHTGITFVSYLYLANRYFKVHNFVDDTIFLNFNSCENSIKKQVNYDLEA